MCVRTVNVRYMCNSIVVSRKRVQRILRFVRRNTRLVLVRHTARTRPSDIILLLYCCFPRVECFFPNKNKCALVRPSVRGVRMRESVRMYARAPRCGVPIPTDKCVTSRNTADITLTHQGTYRNQVVPPITV